MGTSEAVMLGMLKTLVRCGFIHEVCAVNRFSGPQECKKVLKEVWCPVCEGSPKAVVGCLTDGDY